MANDADLSTAPPAKGTRPPAVLQVLPRLVTGGVERGTVELTQALVAAGWKAVVASEGGPMASEVQRAGGTHVTLPLASKNPITMRRNVGRLAEVIRQQGIDIVHARSRAPAWSAWAAAQNTGRHFVTTFHNAYGASNALKRRYNSVMARGERVIAISEFVGEHAASVYRVGEDRLRVIPRGVDVTRFDPERISAERLIALARQWQLPDGVPVVMLPGRLTRWKGQEVLIEAVSRLERRDFLCLVVGSGKARYKNQLTEQVQAKGVGSLFRMVDECRDMPAAYMLADLVVSASTQPEGFGRIVVEAEAMGRPVIATDHGGARETVAPGETGWLVAPGDPDALAAAIDQALSLTAEQRLVLAERAIHHARNHFDSRFTTERTIAVYEEILFPEAAAEAEGPVAA